MLTIRRAQTTEEIELIFALTEKIYREHKYIPDDFDYHSYLWELHRQYETTYLMVIPEGATEPVASVALMTSETELLPTEKYYSWNVAEELKISRNQAFNVSRLVNSTIGTVNSRLLLTSLVSGICEWGISNYLEVGVADMTPDMISLLEKHIGVGITVYPFTVNPEMVPFFYQKRFLSSLPQAFMISKTDAVAFLEKVTMRLLERGVVFDL
jgi:hypothetical protein